MIASRFGVTAEQMIRSNPALNSVPVYPGMILEVPGYEVSDLPAEGYLAYMVQPDDSLYSISNKFKLNYGKVIAQNTRIENPNIIWPGQIIYLVYSD
jgi:LysM repeat protein